VDILRMGTAAIAAVGMMWVGAGTLTHTDPPPPVFISAPPLAAPDAYQCAVHCHVDWHDGDIGATDLHLPPLAQGKDIGAPTMPTVVYVPTYIHDTPVATVGTGSTAASVAPRATGGSTGKASSKGSKGSSGGKASGSKSSSAKAPRQTQPSTTVTTKDSTRTTTTAKGTTSTTTTHTTSTKRTG